MQKLIIACFLFISVSCNGQKSDSLDFKIGQMLMMGVNETSQLHNEGIINDIRKGHVGGVILFEKNINPENSSDNLKSFTSSLSKDAPIPLFVAIDQEGGLVNRLKEKYKFPKSVTAQYLGKTANLDSTRYYAESTAATLKSLGFNVNFAPVVDILVEGNPVIANTGRSYSSDPDSVTLHAEVVVDAMRKKGIVSVLKHFPGHGSSRSDSHLGFVEVTEYWDKRELIPYKSMLKDKKVDGIMSAHIVNRKLDDSGLPGTLSSKIMTGLLRNDFGYDGVIFSDDMQMKAITNHYGLEKALALSINAGIDVMIFSNNIQGSENRTVDTVHNLIKKLVKDGVISEKRIDESYKRILKLKNERFNG
jgi:beta-N-acetylhexosaminidase